MTRTSSQLDPVRPTRPGDAATASVPAASTLSAPATAARELVVVVTPFAEPNAALVAAVERAGGLGVLDLGRDAARARRALADAARWCDAFAVRVGPAAPLRPADLPAGVDTVLLADPDLLAATRPTGIAATRPTDTAEPANWDVASAAGPAAQRRVLVEVTSVAGARAALAAGADGVVARGSEAGGLVGDLTTFTLLQHLRAASLTTTSGAPAPFWAAGGIGPHSAAGAVALGAVGVVLDAQLALVREVELPAEVASAIRAMDGSETTLLGDHRVYIRPDLPVARLAAAPANNSAPPRATGEIASDLRDTGGEIASDGTLPAGAGATPTAAEIATRLGARDLRAQLLPIGQDGAFAGPLADQHVTASGVVGAVRAAIVDQLATAASLRPLAPGAPFAAARGLRYPLAQGPMTRVSDVPAFAKAVADGGGLPFLALALLTGEQSRALLAETAELLGDAPWGVGVLGFAPPEVRNAQLEAVLAVRPPCALIAGGRPAQATPLEAAGIDTFLHVPSPGLLDRFVADGARKFVFEGRECGGHVGPRASFALWEAQVAGLLAAGERAGGTFFEELHLLFAGGVHDEASAAAVAAVVAPLAARGAKVGALMGTAYLFTDEAVTTGAIQAGFQDAALACERTVLLETSPGHATRCVRSPFVDTFLAARADLAAAGRGRQEMWAELESLNLGRLRIASKGVRRDGGALVTVDPATQAAEGMFMIGQVAALRAERTTVPALHEQVTTGAGEALAQRAAELGLVTAEVPAQAGTEAAHDGTRRDAAARSVAAVRETARPLDIAIVGMAAVFPGAPDVETFWANIVSGVDAVTEVPADRFDADLFYAEDAFVKDAGKMTPSKWGGFLPPVPFDALAYGIPPRSLRSIETGQLLALEVAARALRDAGYDTGIGGQDRSGARRRAGRAFDRSRTSVVFGAEAGADLSGAYGLRAGFRALLGDLPAELDDHLPELDEDSFPGILANVIAGRVANRLDLGGSNFTVDAACASSFAALDAACKELVAGNADMVLCGGADTHNGLNDFLMFASVHALSPSGKCASFDSSADGITLGEGVAVVVLKRLADAERDGDRIQAVVRAVAGSSDGRALGLTAPRRAGQVLSLERAYGRAGVSPSEVGLVEAHATGTVVGDRTELSTLTDVFTEHGAEPGSITVGSVKSQIGHTKCAAGMAGLIKATRALAAGVRPPTLHVTKPNPAWEAGSSPFAFERTARPWAAPAAERHAGVSAFGFGGTNFHVVLSAYDGAPEPAHGLGLWPAELFVVRGADRAAAARRLDRLAELAETNESSGRPWRLRDLARTVADDRSGPVQLAFVVADLDELPTALARARSFQPDPRAGLFVAPDKADQTDRADQADDAAGPGRVGFLFPGQGSQRPGMLADLFVAFPRLRELLAYGPHLADTMFPPAPFGRAEADAQAAAITDTRAAQPILGLADLAMTELLGTLGIRADDLAGHSYGELVALTVAGALDRADLVGLSEARAAAILAAAGDDPGTMAAVSATAEKTRAALAGAGGLADQVVLANQNAPKQTVISGTTAAVGAALTALSAAGLTAKQIPVAAAFHSPVVAGAAATLADVLAGLDVRPADTRVWSNTTGAPYPGTGDEVRATLAGQVAAPVRFVEQVEAMYAAGVRTFVEVGPGRVLTGLVGKILAGRPHRAVATDVAGEPGLRRLLLAVAELAAAGVPVDVAPLFAGRDAKAVAAADAPRRPGWLVDGAFVRTADGRPVAGGLKPPTVLSLAAPLVPDAAPGSVLLPAEPDVARPVDAAVLEFLRTTRDLVAAQRDVVLGYLGQGGARDLGHDGALLDGLGLGSVTPRAFQPGGTQPAGRALAIPAQAVPVEPAVAQAPVTPSNDVPAGPVGRGVVLDAVVEVIGSQTGYPAEMLEPGLDLEADLSIDSIKRTEILGELAGRLGLAGAEGGELDESVVEELAAIKTVDGIVDWIVAHTSGAAANAAEAPQDATGAASTRIPLRRFVVEPVPLPAAPSVAEALARLGAARPDGTGPLAGGRFAVVEGGLGVGLELADLLEQAGAAVRLLDAGAPDLADQVASGVAADGLLWVAALDAGTGSAAELPGAFGALKAAVLGPRAAGGGGGTRRLVLASGLGGDFGRHAAAGVDPGPAAGAGFAGLARTLAHELPDVAVRVVDVDPKDAPRRIAESLLTEMLASDAPLVVGHRDGIRAALRVVPVELAAPETAGLETAGLGPDSVVLLTGGARGITALLAMEIARRSGAHVELVGRTPPPAAPEDPATAGALDAPALRRALIATGMRKPAEIEARLARLLAEREVRATLAELDRVAAGVRYHAVDVRDAAAVRAVVADVYARHGRLDGVVHGAGVLEDRLVRDKTPESFARVYSTKVDGARALLGALRRDRCVRETGSAAPGGPDLGGPGFVVLFGSVAGVFGNRGQVDYAAANDTLDALAHAHAGVFRTYRQTALPGSAEPAGAPGRVVSVDWGPWRAEGGGMVSAELEREYARRGIGLIEPAEGVAALLHELSSPHASGTQGPAQVVYLCGEADALHG
ncbi:type I polyketide synthase [Frankia sp. AgB1.8]|uniref:type I polyketide synthase n=1 Tax=Frankia sp. AgB1.8 TaxID=2792839 RepID=UPI001931A61C|nr:type I polyketide synthase [Frankia sp. AgB1.8]MBL7617869.1 SDR family NAD(P)-dependent oxidoreductase [Frankia sp. AgB1.8]